MTTYINKPMLEYMKKLTKRNIKIHEKNTIDFKPSIMPEFNKRAKNGNYYGYDKYGLIIRRDANNNIKSPFGWIRTPDDEIVSIHLKTECPEDIRKKETFFYIQSKFAGQWNNTTNIFRRIYDKYYKNA